MNILKTAVLCICLGLSAAALGQGLGQERDRAAIGREIIRMGLYPPDAIMRHQQRLGITDDQRAEIAGAVQTFQSEVAELQWNLQNNQQLLREALAGYRIDTPEALSLAEKVLQMESAFKLAHFRLLIAVKNALTEQQIDMLRAYIEQRRQQAES